MPPRKIKDVEDIMARIMETTVPDKGQLKNPIKDEAATRKKSGQRKLSEMLKTNKSLFPDEMYLWTTRTFVDYFADQYYHEIGGNYKKTYITDSKTFQDVANFLASNNLERQLWTKRFVDWCFRAENRQTITRREGHFTPQTIARYLNHFYQEVVLPGVETGTVDREENDTSLLEEIKQADVEGRATEIFVRFGIPVAFTYLTEIRGFNEDNIVKGMQERFRSLYHSDVSEREKLGRIFLSSIIGSPYPEGFHLLNWRERFSEFTQVFEVEGWWRKQDYKGKPLPKYKPLMATEK